MNRNDSKKIALIITNEQILEMFNNAKNNIKDWTKVSNCNKGMSKGAAWNILASGFDKSKEYHILAKINFVREFGEFLPEDLKIKKDKSKSDYIIIHQEPKF